MCNTCGESAISEKLHLKGAVLPESDESQLAASNPENEQMGEAVPSSALRSGVDGEQRREQMEEVASSALRSSIDGEQQTEGALQVASVQKEDSSSTQTDEESSGDKVETTPSIPEQVNGSYGFNGVNDSNGSNDSNGTAILNLKMFLRRPSPYRPSDPRFQQVQVRRFAGTQETPFSLYDDCAHSPSLSRSGFIFNGDAIEVTIVSVTT